MPVLARTRVSGFIHKGIINKTFTCVVLELRKSKEPISFETITIIANDLYINPVGGNLIRQQHLPRSVFSADQDCPEMLRLVQKSQGMRGDSLVQQKPSVQPAGLPAQKHPTDSCGESKHHGHRHGWRNGAAWVGLPRTRHCQPFHPTSW